MASALLIFLSIVIIPWTSWEWNEGMRMTTFGPFRCKPKRVKVLQYKNSKLASTLQSAEATYTGIFPEVRMAVDCPNIGIQRSALGHLEASDLSGLGQDTPNAWHWWECPQALLQTVFEVLQRLEILTVGDKKFHGFVLQLATVDCQVANPQ